MRSVPGARARPRPRRGSSRARRCRARGFADLGRDDDVVAVAARRQPLADDRLRLAAVVARHPRRVDVGGVDEVAAGRGVGVEHGEGVVAVGGPAEDVAAEAEGEDVEVGAGDQGHGTAILRTAAFGPQTGHMTVKMVRRRSRLDRFPMRMKLRPRGYPACGFQAFIAAKIRKGWIGEKERAGAQILGGRGSQRDRHGRRNRLRRGFLPRALHRSPPHHHCRHRRHHSTEATAGEESAEGEAVTAPTASPWPPSSPPKNSSNPPATTGSPTAAARPTTASPRSTKSTPGTSRNSKATG